MTSPDLPVARSGRSALEVACGLAEEAGRMALKAFRQPQKITMKGRGNPLTETDLACERYIIDALAKDFPDCRVLSEETAADTSIDGLVWVVDPIDGTKNFASGIPFFCCNIALCLDGEPLVAATHDPNQGETFSAQRNAGAFVNGQPIRASTRSKVGDSVVGLDLGYDDERGRSQLQLAVDLFPGMQSLRIPGSAALGIAYAACGRFDVFMHRFLYPWDIAAGILLVREAGGTITEFDGSPVRITSQTVLAGGTQVHAEFLAWDRARQAKAT